ncbi:hypothetical protein ACFV84_18755 [Kitasatospora sp. NPDC059811]|uniref:hypothetical protein n=1 Tax=Streptomycetaceae TaxID=2062 RepID=UPI0007AFA044|nr:hypothetical protein [Streptomyces sp. MJM8645]
MRSSRLALFLALAAVGAATLVAADVAQDEPIRSVSLPVLRDPQAQQKLRRVTDPVQDWAESGDLADAAHDWSDFLLRSG